MKTFTPEESSLLYSPVGLLFRDDLTGRSPLGRFELHLQRQRHGAQGWEDSPSVKVHSSGEVWSFPGLGRATDVSDSPRRFRVVIDSDYYSPELSLQQGSSVAGIGTDQPQRETIEFDVHLYNEDAPLDPVQYAREPLEVFVHPNDRYPFPSHLPVVYGKVVGSAGEPLPGVRVSLGANKRSTVCNQFGAFALPIEWPRAGSWPLVDVFLRSEAKGTRIELDRLGPFGRQPQQETTTADHVLKIELQEDSGTFLVRDVDAGQPEVLVDPGKAAAAGLKPGLSLLLGHKTSAALPHEAVIADLDQDSGRVRLTQALAVSLPKGAPVVAIARASVRETNIDHASRALTLESKLPKPFLKSTRIILLDAYSLDVNREQETMEVKVSVPDGFRGITIHLQSQHGVAPVPIS